MTRSSRHIASQASAEAPPPYSKASNDDLCFDSSSSIASSLPAEYSVNPAHLLYTGLQGAYSRVSTKLRRNAPPREPRKSLGDSMMSSSVAKLPRNAAVDVPPGVHVVQAPYELRRKNSSIFRDLLVLGSNLADTSLPDVRLRTKNALLKSAVYISAIDWNRPVSIHARTKNADLVLGIHTLQADQAVCVRARTKNGRSRIFLPHDFKGLLAISTKNGKCTLSTDLKKVAIRVPSRYKDIAKVDKLFGHCHTSVPIASDVPSERSNGVDVCYEINGNGPSTAVVDTKNGNVWAGFVQDEEVGCWPSCSVM